MVLFKRSQFFWGGGVVGCRGKDVFLASLPGGLPRIDLIFIAFSTISRLFLVHPVHSNTSPRLFSLTVEANPYSSFFAPLKPHSPQNKDQLLFRSFPRALSLVPEIYHNSLSFLHPILFFVLKKIIHVSCSINSIRSEPLLYDVNLEPIFSVWPSPLSATSFMLFRMRTPGFAGILEGVYHTLNRREPIFSHNTPFCQPFKHASSPTLAIFLHRRSVWG